MSTGGCLHDTAAEHSREIAAKWGNLRYWMAHWDSKDGKLRKQQESMANETVEGFSK